MPQKENNAKKKGSFSEPRLAVSRKYIFPDARRRMWIIGFATCLVVLIYYAIDSFFLKSSVTASGPLSSFHANFEKDCNACHEPLNATTTAKCSVCHEQTGDQLGVYSFAAHYVYQSGDWRRVKTAARPEHEETCAVCHQEHQGRESQITQVPDAYCTNCHVYDSFNDKHPQFQFVAQKMPDDSTLAFTHIRHVKEVAQREKLTDLERTCLHCHNPQADGKHFEPIDFAQHCYTCHLNGSVPTPALKMKGADAPGVETLEDIKRKRAPGTSWAFNANPNEFEIKPGNRLVKTSVHHEDPWILENLKTIQQALYPNAELTDILKTSGTLTTQNASLTTKTVYQETVRSLQNYADGLRSRPEPEVQRELVRIDSLLKVTQNKLKRQTYFNGESKFLLPANKINLNLAAEQIEELNGLTESLTAPCRECHTVTNAAIQRVQKDQQILRRAQFNHRAHILQRRCLECHTEIPIVAETKAAAIVKSSRDRAAIQNVPGIENCRVCHNSTETSNRCVTCHQFHPNKTNRSHLLLYLD